VPRHHRISSRIDHERAERLQADGLTFAEIAEKLGRHPSTVRRWLTPGALEAQREKDRRRRLANPQQQEAIREAMRQRRALEAAAIVPGLPPVTVEALGEVWARFGHACAYCGAAGEALEVDHVLPLGPSGPHTPANVVPACPTCNGRKRAEPLEAWYRRQPFFTDARLAAILEHHRPLWDPIGGAPPYRPRPRREETAEEVQARQQAQAQATAALGELIGVA
jgi:5-methylcytosine-specific restriction endonuclease McrA